MKSDTSIDGVISVDQTCRTCLKKVDVHINIFKYLLEGQLISKSLETCISLQVAEDDKLPQQICSKCIVSLSEVMNFTTKCHNSNKILQSTLQFKNIVSDEDTCVITCDYVKNLIRNDHSYANQQKNEDSAKYNSISEQTSELEMPSQILKSEMDLDIEISDVVGLNEVLKDEDLETGEGCDQESVTDHSYEHIAKADNVSEISTSEDATNSGILEAQKVITSQNKSNKLYKKFHPRKPYCGYCKRAFPTAQVLQQHRINVHAMDMMFTCDFCPKKFKRRSHRAVHMRTHTREKPYECNYCGRKFSLSGNLKRHKMVHTGEKPHMCEHCGRSFIQYVELKNHLLVHLNKKLNCEICGRLFHSNAFLERHINMIHLAGNPDKFIKITLADDNIEHECHECNAKLSSRRTLANHMLTHGESTYLCDDCGKRCKTKKALDIHRRIHTGERPHRCDVCQRGFAQSSSLAYHRRVHTGEKPYGCDLCWKKFTQHAHLKTHMKTHTGERPYKCPFCDKAFALKKNMIVHSRIHTGEKPYTCNNCGKGFYDSSALKKHLRSYKNANDDKVKEECDKGVKYSADIKEESDEYDNCSNVNT